MLAKQRYQPCDPQTQHIDAAPVGYVNWNRSRREAHANVCSGCSFAGASGFNCPRRVKLPRVSATLMTQRCIRLHLANSDRVASQLTTEDCGFSIGDNATFDFFNLRDKACDIVRHKQ